MKRKLLLTLLGMIAFGLMGCGNKLDPTVPVFNGGVGGFDVPGAPGGNNDSSSFTSGATAKLNVVSDARMSQFTLRPLNNPENIEINVLLDDFGGGAYGGYVKIAYDDGNHHQVNEFSAGNNSTDAQYNVWFTKNGNDVWHGFFEDEYGAVIVVIDDVVDLGDGLNTGQVAGSVWFKNFQNTSAPNPSSGCLPGFGCPSTRCWFVEIGPYECRSFLQNGKIRTTSMVEPNNGYVKLGTFSGLDRALAFSE